MTRTLKPTIALITVLWNITFASITSDLRALNLSSDTEILSPPQTTRRWSSYHAPVYVVTVIPTTDEDVAKIVCNFIPSRRNAKLNSEIRIEVTYAANSLTPFLSTGGGHGFTTTLGSLRNGI
jgi:hypothetical protein